MNKSTNSPIGIFDSGLGGLTVLQSLESYLPNESFIYFGDTARVPYGNKSAETVIHYSKQIVEFLQIHGVKMIVVACNTSSALALNILKDHFNLPVFGVIEPSVNLAESLNSSDSVVVLGTRATINSHSYSKMFTEIHSAKNIVEKSCPLFVPIIEEGLEKHPIAQLMSKEYLSPLIKQNIDALILGCTHYPILKKTINHFIPPEVEIIDSAEILSSYTKQYLKQGKLTSSSSHSTTRLLVTDPSEHFDQFACNILNNNFCNISTIHPF